MSEGWPEGWELVDRGAVLLRAGAHMRDAAVDLRDYSEGGFYVEIEGPLFTTAEEALEMARRAVWAMEPRQEIDREELAQSLLTAQHFAAGEPSLPWQGYKLAYRDSWLTVADEAIRLLGGTEARVEMLTKIEELERRNAALTATANAAIERAEKAEEERDVLRDYDSPFEEDAEDLRAEVQRLRQALAAALSGAQSMATVAALLNGEADDA